MYATVRSCFAALHLIRSLRRSLTPQALLTAVFTFHAGAVAKYCDEYVCLSVCPRGYLQNHTRDLYQVLCMLSLVRGSVLLRRVYDRLIAYRREGVFFPTENALSAGKGGWEFTARANCYLRLPCLRMLLFLYLYLSHFLRRLSTKLLDTLSLKDLISLKRLSLKIAVRAKRCRTADLYVKEVGTYQSLTP